MSHDFLDHGDVRFLFAESGTKGVARAMCAAMGEGFRFAIFLLRLDLFCSIVLIEDTSDRAINVVGAGQATNATTEDKIRATV